ncbi:MAG: potassium-transporting ATPase subunit KdpC [Acidobacteriota bacterium]|nr:potassium-transporting ATPase subunit KdpC [Acidobacteriota bacterium]
MWRHIGPAFRIMIVMTILFGFVYPGVVTGVCQILFPRHAEGSLIYVDGKIEGSRLIGQNFKGRRYFHPRPSAAGVEGYDPMDSGGSNLGPTSRALFERVKGSVARFRAENPEYRGRIPADLVTASASGLDPDISPASAEAQAERIARARGMSLSEVRRLIRENTSGRQLAFLGEPRVNVLELNLALDRRQSRR